MRKCVYFVILPMLSLVVGCPTTMPASDTVNSNDSSMADQTDSGVAMTDVAAGASNFATSCAVCHADDATGNIGPNIQNADIPLVTDHVINAHEGHTTFEFSAQDIADIQAFLASL